MYKHLFVPPVGLALILLSITACSSGDEEKKIGASEGAWTIFPMPYAPTDPVMPNPIATIDGSAEVFEVGGKTKVKLTVSMLPATRTFGAHLHKLACGDNKAGTHYQHEEFPPDSSATDPVYANDKNEIWLDFTTDASGKAAVERTVDWRVTASRAKAVVIHHMMTGTGGVAGAKLACINLNVQ